jgi:hypothetical protein
MNNQGQLGKAIFTYATTKEKFPPLFTAQPDPSNPPILNYVGWVPEILPNIEQNPMYVQFQNNTLQNQAGGEIATLLCPSRDPSNSPAPLNYVVNGGAPDSIAPNQQMDYQENAVFFDAYSPKYRMPANMRPKPTSPIDLSYLATHDGSKQTILLTENMDAQDWYIFAGSPIISATKPPPIQNQNGNSWWNAVVAAQPAVGEDPQWGITVSPVTGVQKIFNQPSAVMPASAPNLGKDIQLGRPRSNHSGGFFVTYCDAHAEWMSDEIEYRVYCLLMAPDSNATKYTTTPPAANAMSVGTQVQYPKNWYVGNVITTPLGPLKSLTEADINK